VEGADVLMGGYFVGNPRGEVVQVGAELLIFLLDFGELVGGRVELGGNCHNARDGGTYEEENGAFTSSDGLECVR